MKSNRLFYIGLGCLFSTLCWTVFMIIKAEANLPNLEVDTLTCKELRVLDSNGKVGISIYDHHYGDGGGSTLLMSFKDNRIFSNGLVSEGELVISDRGLHITNTKGRDVLRARLESNNGYFKAERSDGSNKFHIDTENAKYSKTHCPCRLVK